jgi:hypothetical protein
MSHCQTVGQRGVRSKPELLGRGDIVHNLRGAYDLLACDLVRHNGGEVTRGTGFPISASLDGFTQNLPRQLSGASDTAIDLDSREAQAQFTPCRVGAGGCSTFDYHKACP